MRSWPPAVALRRLASEPKAWLGAEVALLLIGSLVHGSLWGGLAWMLVAPILLMGFMLFYGMAVLAPSVIHVALLGAALGALFVFLQGMGEGIDSEGAWQVFITPVAILLLCRAVHVYLSPIWAGSLPD